MTKKISEYFMAYEETKVFAIRKMKTQFTNKNTHILRTDILQKQCRRKLLFIGGLKTRGGGPRKFLNLESLKCHFLDFQGTFRQNTDVQKKAF
jgi:hypothetical protein